MGSRCKKKDDIIEVCETREAALMTVVHHLRRSPHHRLSKEAAAKLVCEDDMEQWEAQPCMDTCIRIRKKDGEEGEGADEAQLPAKRARLSSGTLSWGPQDWEQEDKGAHQWGQQWKQQHWEQEGKGKRSSSDACGQGKGLGKVWQKGTEMMTLTMGNIQPHTMITLRCLIDEAKLCSDSTTHLCAQAVREFAEESMRVQHGGAILTSYAQQCIEQWAKTQQCIDILFSKNLV